MINKTLVKILKKKRKKEKQTILNNVQFYKQMLQGDFSYCLTTSVIAEKLRQYSPFTVVMSHGEERNYSG